METTLEDYDQEYQEPPSYLESLLERIKEELLYPSDFKLTVRSVLCCFAYKYILNYYNYRTTVVKDLFSLELMFTGSPLFLVNSLSIVPCVIIMMYPFMIVYSTPNILHDEEWQVMRGQLFKGSLFLIIFG